MSPRAKKRTGKIGYMISSVAEMYNIHPQTLRLYERENLLIPSRSDGNTRLYGKEDLERLEVILQLTRELGVNLAGVEIILNMRDQMNEMQREMQEFVKYVREHMTERSAAGEEHAGHALVRVAPSRLIRMRRQG